MPSKRVSRREFVRRAGAAAAAFHIVPRHVLGRGHRAPSDTLSVGCVGVGGMGRTDVRGLEGETIYALCDVDSKMAEDAFVSYPRAKRYGDFREMLEKDGRNIDAVTVSTADHTHAVVAMAALKAGKHVYCQKPLARTLSEVRSLMAEARRRPSQATQMGNQGHSQEGTRQIREWVEAGLIGKVERVELWTDRPIWPQGIDRPTEAHNVPPWLNWELWLGPAASRPYHPAYAPFRWRGWWDFGTGALGDIACHSMDAAFWVLDLGFPSRISAESSALFPETAPKSSRIEYDFPAKGSRGPIKVVWRDGGLLPPKPLVLDAKWPPMSDGGQLWVGDQGEILAGLYGQSPRLLDPAKQEAVTKSPLPVVYPRTEGVYKEWVAACKAGTQPGSNFAGHAGPLTEMVLLGNLAVRLARPLDLDPATGAVTGTTVPEELVTPEYRSGWKL